MNDKELFLKYNIKDTRGLNKNENLDQILFNEQIQDKPLKEHTSILLLLHGSYACNCACVYCENQHLRHEHGVEIMSEEMVERIVRVFGNRLREVTWHGGEPLLLPESLIEKLNYERDKNQLDFDITLQTNSILLSPEKVEFLNRLGIQYGTSFDGINNDISRGKKSTAGILDLISRGQCPGFIAVTYSDTIDMMIENYEYFKSLGVTAMQGCIVRENVIENSNPYLISNEVAIPKVLEYIKYWMYDTENPILDTYLERQIGRVVGSTHLCEDSYCVGGWLIIDPLGNISHCGQNGMDNALCNINDIETADELFNSKKYLEMINKQRKLVKTCQDCPYYSVCYGGCIGLNYEHDPTYQEVNPRNCEYIRGLLDGIYELIKDLDLSDESKYNSHFLRILKDNNYYSLTEIKEIENRYGKYSDNELL